MILFVSEQVFIVTDVDGCHIATSHILTKHSYTTPTLYGKISEYMKPKILGVLFTPW